MKIKDLARELSLSGDEVLEKAKAMGIKVSGTSDDLSDIDTTAVKNTILKGGTHTETKVVRTRAKKSDAEKKDGGPKVTVKAANIKLPEKKKTVKAASKPAVRTAAKPPAGKPIVPKEVEGRPKPPEGKPVVSKSMLEKRIAEEEAAKQVAAEAKADKPAAPAEEQQSAAKAQPAKKTAAKPETKTEQKQEKTEKPAEKKPEAPRRQTRLKVIKRAEDVRREEAEAAERRAAAREKRQPKKRSGAEIVTAKPAIEKMKSVANGNHLIAKAASRAKRKTLARARIAAADLLREEMMLPAMWQYPSRLPTEERRRTRKKNTISFPSWNGAAARAESRSPWKNR